MNNRLRKGLRIGNFVVHPESGLITGARGSHHLSSDRIEILMALAEAPGEPLLLADLAGVLGMDVGTDRDILERHIQAIRESLDDTGKNPRFIVVSGDEVTLIAPVLPGTGDDVQGEPADDGEKLSFFKQLQRRKVIRVGAGYIVLAWVAIQVADTLLPALLVPRWVITLTVAIAMLGFPIALVVAWLYEVTPVGMLRDQRRMPHALSRRQKIVDVAAIGSLALVVGYIAVGVLSDARRVRDEDLVTSNQNRTIFAANTVAVLPFRYMGGNIDDAYIGDGIAEEILRLLSRIKELRVTARTASFYFKDKPNVDIDTIADKLKVRHLLTGSIQRAGDNIRINVELFDASTSKTLWSERFDRKILDIFDIQSEIARMVADQSERVLSEESLAQLSARPTESLDAYEFYLKGRDYLRQPRVRDTLDSAQRLFHNALAHDPNYALALAGLCETHLAVYELTKSTATVDDAESDCRAALEVDESLPEVHTALGLLYMYTGEFDKSEQEFRTAIGISPNFFEAFSGLGDVLVAKKDLDAAEIAFRNLVQLQPAYWRGYQKLGAFYYRQGKDPDALPNFAKVIELTPDNAPGWNNLGSVNYMLGNLEAAANAWKRAIELEPTASIHLNLGTMYYYLGRYEEAVEMHRGGVRLSPEDYRIWGRMAAAYVAMGDREAEALSAYNQAISAAEKILEINPNEAIVLKNVALFYAHAGQATLAKDAATRALDLSPKDPDAHFMAALTYLALGDVDGCLDRLERAVTLGYSMNLMQNEPALDTIRDNERFRNLMTRASVTT